MNFTKELSCGEERNYWISFTVFFYVLWHAWYHSNKYMQQYKWAQHNNWFYSSQCLTLIYVFLLITRLLLKSKINLNTVAYSDRASEISNNTGKNIFITWKLICVSRVFFHAEFEYVIRIALSPTVIVWQNFFKCSFREFSSLSRYQCVLNMADFIIMF
jgi:hypothetical protein